MSVESAEMAVRDLAGTLSLQLSEVEMLTSMFPDHTEFAIDDPGSVAEIQAFVDGQIDLDSLQCRIGFSIKLTVAEKPLELVCRLPHDYPSVLPHVFIRAASLSRVHHQLLSEAIHSYLDTQQLGELLICSLIDWLQENAAKFLNTTDPFPNKPDKVDPKNTTFSRMWIYSHHIYSKIKRKDMLEFADELNLTGFYVPGKPGIIVIEGYGYDVEVFWGRIRRMQWKKLTMKEKEDCDIGINETVDDFRKFGAFEENYFTARQGKGRGCHADRGLLYQFLEEKGCGKMFNIYFNVDGKLADGDD